MSRGSVRIGLIALGLAPAVLLSVFLLRDPGSPGKAQVTLPPIHYECFQIPPQTYGITVDLETQFGLEHGVVVQSSGSLCVPALKNGGGDLTVPHLKCFSIQPPEGQPPEDPIHEVTLTDQFHVESNVPVGAARELCIPALKQVIFPPPEPPTPTPGVLPPVPHYKCYDITGTPPTVPPLTLETQFGIDPTEPGVPVGPPTRLCAPAIKTLPDGTTYGDLNAPHLKCYSIGSTFDPPYEVNLETQFGPETNVRVDFAFRLCQAVEKVVTFPTPTPTAPPTPTPTAPVTPTPPPLDIIHYKCYGITPQTLSGVAVDLQTQFGTEPDVPVINSKFLCPPAVKTIAGGPPEGDLRGPHLKCYSIASTENPTQVVRLTTQFGTFTAAVDQATELCVPALKAIVPDPPSGTLPTVPHYKCYNILGPGTDITVALQTQFGTEAGVSIGQASKLCAPALKTYLGGPEGDLTAPHLVCYNITPQVDVPVSVNLQTQFGSESPVDVFANERLCVPATKEIVATPTPTPTPTPTLPPTPTPSPTPTPTATPDWCPGTLPPWWVPPGDADCDGFPSTVKVGMRGAESYMGTDAADACADTVTKNDENPDPWPMDNNDDRQAGLADILAYIPIFGQNVPPGPARYDINQDGKDNLTDILMFIPFFNMVCTP